jgi:hypothetical protein
VAEARHEFRREIGQLRGDLPREITDSLQAVHQREMAELAAATVQASAAGQRELVSTLTASFEMALQSARLADRQDFLTALEQLDRRRALEFAAMREGFHNLAEKTGGAFREADTRLNALANVLPISNSGGSNDPNP